ncbi:radical SAM protein [Desulfonatronovibrio hydrogenovorans]|uniref:radical SAM protein n=1 Tax=Desulfonatronovibrio hydrogenovorans TaxID=53245 RepID=UPI00048F9E40|nr:radical SAM protein [Desulfonatronovibrio hydrogenovorans]
MKPGYLVAYENNVLSQRIAMARKLAGPCLLCPRKCMVNRLGQETGFCNTGRQAQVAAWNLHFGEEAPLVGRGGSGTVFFAHCNLGCVFCQNHDISDNLSNHEELNSRELAEVYLSLQAGGAENINLVTPSHVVLQILESLNHAAGKGLRIPLVYNTSSYDRLATLELLDGIVDIYLADTKFFQAQPARKYAEAPDYPERAKKALLEMNRQVGSLVIEEGVARKGLMIRHLVMPEDIAGSDQWLQFFADHLPADTYINIMGQYHPCGRAASHPELLTGVPGSRIAQLRKKARDLGLERLDQPGGGIFRLLG